VTAIEPAAGWVAAIYVILNLDKLAHPRARVPPGLAA
jgi:hypothetical protein